MKHHHDLRFCTTGLPSDVAVEIGEMSFNLHKLTSLNIVSLRCAAEYLQMNENYGEGNLIAQTEGFLNEVFSNWVDSIKALGTCEVLPYAEDLHIVSRCIDSLAMKACADPTLFGWPVSGCTNVQSPAGVVLWNGISTVNKPQSVREDWWYGDVSFLSLPFYKRMMQAVELRGMKPERVAGSLIFYAKRSKALLEDIVDLLPNQKGVTSTKFLLRLLRTAMILHTSSLCRENLERRVGAQLDQAVLEDLLIPNMGYSVETLYDIDCVQRILDHFMSVENTAVATASPCIVEEGKLMDGPDFLTPVMLVANLVDGYLAEVAPDVNLKLPKFQSLAAAVPDYARPVNDSIYHAIDLYLKAHPWLIDSEREQICRLMNCQKLSLEASTHAAQNERLPLRVIVQVLFFEQLRLRTTVSGWFFVSDNLANSQDPNDNLGIPKTDGSHQVDPEQDHGAGVDDMRERVLELEKECLSMKQEIQKLVKMKRSWNIIPKMLVFRQKSQRCNSKKSRPCDVKTPLSSSNGHQNHEHGELGN
ncbi:BTB/POZ domain-containing protein [Vitis vinifera]|uniref:BTB/POZ domain-containing protein n=1 Tax=Vitis vinifera TaxID=29760 RepID=A0A438H6R4_VITVI|nr:BTB/POZ domain-containing protein [Vitis vinifera]